VGTSWWPASAETPFTWGWRAHPGVWAVATLLAVGYLLAARRHPPTRRQFLGFAAGWLTLWLALDWPAGTLGAGYLVSVRTSQYLVITLVAAPLLLLGVPRGLFAGAGPVATALHRITHPAVAIPVFALALGATHLPAVVNALAPHAAGSFAIAAAWVVAALVYWWRLVGPEPDARRLPYLAGFVYLVLPFLLPKVPGLIYAFSERSFYQPYTAAPTPFGLSPGVDQQVAGFLLWFAGSVMVLVAIGALFHRWYTEDRRLAAGSSIEVPADPRAVALLFEVPGAWHALEQLVAIVEAALPPAHRGAELGFAYREHAGGGAHVQVVLELRVAVPPAAERRLAERVEADYAAVLRRLGPRAPAVAERLAFSLVTYGTRVG